MSAELNIMLSDKNASGSCSGPGDDAELHSSPASCGVFRGHLNNAVALI